MHTPAAKKWIAVDEQSIVSIAHNSFERSVDFTAGAGVKVLDTQSN
jgi:hypothetical protein